MPKLYNRDVRPGPYNTESVDDYLKAILELSGADEERVTSNAWRNILVSVLLPSLECYKSSLRKHHPL
jgi:hypothetical protein